MFDCGHVGKVKLPVGSGKRVSGLVGRKRGRGPVISGVGGLIFGRFDKR